jgi:vacuolar-type H+-ATPase subunit E/Vma4
MSLETILQKITASGEAELKELRRETETHVQNILAEAEQEAAERREAARQAALQPVSGECARRTHKARLEALQLVGQARDEMVAEALAQVEACLRQLRHSPMYPTILKRLIEEAVRVLGKEELNGELAVSLCRPELAIDPQDEPLWADILTHLGLDLNVVATLDSWGGIILRSGDGRIIVTNTLEARLERAIPFLRHELATFFEQEAFNEHQEAVTLMTPA